jgi:alkaline phosphatase
MKLNGVWLLGLLSLALVTTASPALALPTGVSVTPPNGARFLTGQRFDLRVEGKGTGPFWATLSIDGVPQSFTSGTQGSVTTDAISADGYGGFNLRGYSSLVPGPHQVSATFTDSSGTVSVNNRFEALGIGDDRGIRNLIIMLGDGMGVAHRTAARLVKYGVTAGQPNGYLAMDRFPGTGLVTTHSLNSIVTDSAPGMACYTTGSHANNGQEGVYPAHVKNPFFFPRVEYLAEYLHRVRGTALGLVTTADVEDATPAANAVHTGDRNAGTGVCDQYLDEADSTGTRTHGSGLAVLLGGGRRWFLPAASGQFGSSRATANSDYPALPADLALGWQLPATGAIDPTRNLLGDFVARGFAYAESATDLRAIIEGREPRKLLGLFGYGNMNAALDKLAKRRGVLLPDTTTFAVDDYHAPDQPMLDEMTEAALKVLRQNRAGFVLMVEGAHIDKQSHLMDADRVIDETIEFDNAVAVARRFAERDPSTLVLVLADHECSGFSLIGALTGGIQNLRGLPSDSAVLDPATAPGRQGVVGTYDAAGFPRYLLNPDDGYPETLDVDGKVLVGFGASANRYEGWLSKPRPVIDSLLPSSIKGELAALGYPAEPTERAEKQFGFFLRGQVPGPQAVHTAADIPVSAFSRTFDYRAFVGVQTNTDVFFKLMRAALGAPHGWRDGDSSSEERDERAER